VGVDAVLSLYVGTGISEGMSWKTPFMTQLVGLLLDEKLVLGGTLCCYCCFGMLLFRESVGRICTSVCSLEMLCSHPKGGANREKLINSNLRPFIYIQRVISQL